MRRPIKLASLPFLWIFVVACSTPPPSATTMPTSTPLAVTPPMANNAGAQQALEQFMQARIDRAEEVILTLLTEEFRDRVYANKVPPEIELFQASNPCWYRFEILSASGSDSEFVAVARVYQHWWAGDNGGGLPYSWAQAVVLQITEFGWKVDGLSPIFDEREEPGEPHGPTVSACSAYGHPTASPTPVEIPYIEPAISQYPAAGVCGLMPGEIVTISINIDVPDPRCVQVNASQRLRVVNNTETVVELEIAYFKFVLVPDGEGSIDVPFGDYLDPGVHRLQISPILGGAEIVLVE